MKTRRLMPVLTLLPPKLGLAVQVQYQGLAGNPVVNLSFKP